MKASFLLLTILGVIAVKLVTGKIDRGTVANVVSDKQQPAIAGKIAGKRRSNGYNGGDRTRGRSGSCSHCYLTEGRTDGPCKPYSLQPENCVNQAESNYCSDDRNGNNFPCKARSSGGGSGSGSNSGFAKKELDKHNNYRSLHGAPGLRHGNSLENAAQDWANHLARIGRLDHDQNRGGNVGENVAYSCGYSPNPTKQWYDEESLYDYGRPGYSDATGHFTQVVWKGTSKLGIAKATSNGCTYVVARYSPSGNVRGRFPANVKQPTWGK